MRVRLVYPAFARHAEHHPELRTYVPCEEYLGPPSLALACLAAVTPSEVTVELRDDRREDVGLDDPPDLVALSCFTPNARRAMALADAFRARGARVVLGGIFPTVCPDEAAAHADAIVIGEGEPVWRGLLADARRGRLAPRYRAAQPADLDALPPPRTELYFRGLASDPDDYPVQLHRGCPLRCNACVLPASMGRMLRSFPLAHVLAQIELLERHGKLASFTEDTSFLPGGAAQRRLTEVLSALAERGGGAVSYVGTSAPLVLITRPELFDLLRRAGVRMFYLVGGFDPITRAAFTGDAKARRRFVDAVRRCADEGIEPYTSFLVGNDDDDEGVFDRMLEAAEEAGIRKAEFAIRTPYPGTPDFARLDREGRLLHRDWSRYNDANVVFRPARMTPERLLEGYLQLWRELYRTKRGLASLPARERTIQF